jgi:WD40 repeat protein
MLRGHGGWVLGVAFSPDGRSLATGSIDKTARLWDVATGNEITILHGLDAVNSITFSPDGRKLATGSLDGAARLWPVGQGLIELACARVHDLPLSVQDKQRFGIEDEWCTAEVSAAFRAKLGMNAAPPAVPTAGLQD